ncbi:hypothetical protein ACJX0J_006842, partial [Zea mays]
MISMEELGSKSINNKYLLKSKNIIRQYQKLELHGQKSFIISSLFLKYIVIRYFTPIEVIMVLSDDLLLLLTLKTDVFHHNLQFFLNKRDIKLSHTKAQEGLAFGSGFTELKARAWFLLMEDDGGGGGG